MSGPGAAFAFIVLVVVIIAIIISLVVLRYSFKQVKKTRKQKILIIGSRGMLGTALVERFKGTHEVIGLDRPEIDITDEQSAREKIVFLKPDVIINCAAINAVDDIEIKPEVHAAASSVNATAMVTLGAISEDLDIPIVHFSSDYVFDGERLDGYFETDDPNPINKYGETKVEGELLLKIATSNHYIIRLSRLFGPAGTADGVKKSFVDKMIELAALGKEVKVIDDEYSCPTYSKDLADFVYSLLEKKLPYGIYHGANSGACTWYQWAQEIFKLKAIPVEIKKINEEDLARPAKRPAHSELRSTKTEPLRSWQEALKDYLSTF